MVFKKSVYRKQYRDPVWASHYPHYQAKVDYRIHRRRMEHHHQIFDWDWDSESSNGEQDGRGRPKTAPNLNNNSQGRWGGRGQERGVEVLDREVQTPEWSKMRGIQPNGAKERMTRDVESSTKHNGKRMPRVDEGQDGDSKPAQLTRKHKSATKHPSRDRRRARPSTSPEKKVDSNKKGQVDHPPLVAYGWADQELITGCKKTHNIRASADPLQIYPSALRAMRRRELDIQRQAERGRQNNLREQKLKAMFNIQPQDDSVWLTEYRRNFAGPSQLR